MYGPFTNEELVGEALEPFRGNPPDLGRGSFGWIANYCIPSPAKPPASGRG
jgi:hypothetical protein